MAVTVGTIEISVNANTNKLEAQMTAAGVKAGKKTSKLIEEELDDIRGRIKEIDGAQEAKLVKLRIEEALSDITVDLDFTEAFATLEVAKERAEFQEWVLNAKVEFSERDMDHMRLDWKSFQTELEQHKFIMEGRIALETAAAEAEAERIEAEIEQIEATVKLDLETREATLKKFAFKETTEADVIKMKVETDLSQTSIAADLAELHAMFREIHPDVDPNTLPFELEMAAVRKAQEIDAIEIPVKVDNKSFDQLSKRTERIAEAVILLAEPAAVAIEGILGGSVAVISSAFSALATGAAAAVPAVLALGGAVTAFIVGTRDVKDAMDVVNTAVNHARISGEQFTLVTAELQGGLSTLSPSARAFVEEFARIRVAVGGMQDAVQEELFKGLDESLRDLGTKTLPQMEKALKLSAESLNFFFKNLADVLGGVEFGDLFEDIQPAVDDLQAGFINLIKAIEPFFRAATPAAKELAKSFGLATDSLFELTEAGQKSGDLERFLLEGVESLRTWGQLIRATTDALVTLFDAGRDHGDSMLSSLTDIIDRFDDWMESAEGQSALDEFFTNARESLHALTPLLKGIAEGFGNMLNDDARGRFADTAVLLGELAKTIGELLSKVGETGALNATLAVLNVALGLLADTLNLIPEGLMKVIGGFYAFSKVLGPLQSGLKLATSALKLFGLETTALTLSNPALLITAGAIAAVTAQVIRNNEKTRLAKVGAEEWAEALMKVGPAAIRAEAIARALAQITKEQVGTREGLQALGITVATFADDLLDGKSKVEILARSLEKLGPSGKKMAADLRSGKATIDDLMLAVNSPIEDGGLVDELKAVGISGDEMLEIIDFVNDEVNEYNDGIKVAAITTAELEAAQLAAANTAQGYALDLGAAVGASTVLIPATEALGLAFAVAASRVLTMQDATGAVSDFRDEAKLIDNLNADRLDDYYQGFKNIAGEATIAADKAEALRIAIELLQGGALDFQQTEDALIGSLQDIEAQVDKKQELADKVKEATANIAEAQAEAAATAAKSGKPVKPIDSGLIKTLNDAKQEYEDFQLTVDGVSESAVENRAVVADALEGMTDLVVRGITDQVDPQKIVDEYRTASEYLIGLLDTHFGETQESARALVESYVLTPEEIKALLGDPEKVRALVEGAGEEMPVTELPIGAVVTVPPVIEGEDALLAAAGSLEEQLGLTPQVFLSVDDQELVASKAAVAALKSDIENLPKVNPTDLTAADLEQGWTIESVVFPTIDTSSVDTADVAVTGVIENLGVVGETTAIPTIDTTSITLADTELGYVDVSMQTLDGTTAEPEVDILGYFETDAELDSIISRLDLINGRVVTATVNVSGGVQPGGIEDLLGLANGGMAREGFTNIAGEAGLEWANFRGATRMLSVPTVVPPGTSVRPVREPLTQGTSRVVNVNQYFTLSSADPGAVATQALNRAAVLANR